MLYPSQQIQVEKGDATPFIEMANKIVTTMVFQYGIDEISYVKIKNWFDHKWLNYSGKHVVFFESLGMFERDTALDTAWRKKLTVPPFHPNRVLSEGFTRKRETGNKRIKKLLHKRRMSNDNIHNRIQDYSTNGLFVWYSSNSISLSRASLMVYRIQENEIETWYASFEKKEEWKLIQTKGVGINELKQYLYKWTNPS